MHIEYILESNYLNIYVILVCMELIKKEEIANVKLARSAGNIYTRNKFIIKINELEEGEGLIIRKIEWHFKTTPGVRVSFSQLLSSKRFFIRLIEDRSGWLVKRISQEEHYIIKTRNTKSKFKTDF